MSLRHSWTCLDKPTVDKGRRVARVKDILLRGWPTSWQPDPPGAGTLPQDHKQKENFYENWDPQPEKSSLSNAAVQTYQLMVRRHRLQAFHFLCLLGPLHSTPHLMRATTLCYKNYRSPFYRKRKHRTAVNLAGIPTSREWLGRSLRA